MSSLIGIFHSAREALRQDQLALSATTDNISNQNTAGYAKRVVTLTGRDTVSLSGAAGPQAPVASVIAQRDPTLDRSVAAATASSASAAAVLSALNSLQNVFSIGASGDESSGINSALSGFFSAMRSLSANPTSSSGRTTALAAAQTVASSLRSTTALLSAQADTLNSAVVDGVTAVNAKTSQIAALNGSIITATNRADRDAYIDQRTALVEDLSRLVGVQQAVNSDGSVSLFTTSGAGLVVGKTSHALSTTVVNGATHVIAEGTDVTAGLSGGSIGGAISARDGALASTQTRLDTLAGAFANAVNTVNQAGKKVDGSAGGAIFAGTGAAGIAVVTTSGDAFAAAGQGEGNGGSANADALAALQSALQVGGMSFADALSAIVSSVGTAAASAQTAAAVATATLTQAGLAREAVSGVSLDTEAANLTQYQRSYEAEAKLLSVLDSIFASAINIGTQTAV